MLRRTILAGALALASFAFAVPAFADFTIAVPSGSEGDGLRAAAADYAKLKDIKIEVVQAPYSNLFEKAATAGQTKSGAFDIILMDDPWIPFFAENGHLEELTSYFNAMGTGGPDSDFLAKSLAVCRNPYNTGPFVCLPYVGNAQMFFYDGAKFAEQGVPNGPKTWDDVIKAASAITKAGGGRTFGYVFRGGEGNPVVADFMPIFWSYGAHMFNADRSKVTIDTPEGAAAMKHLHGAQGHRTEGRRKLPGGRGRPRAGRRHRRVVDQLAELGRDVRGPSQSKMVGKISYSAIPSGTHAGSSEIGHWTMGIMSASKHKQEAFDFMVWATSPEQIKISATRGNPPVRFSVFTDPGADVAEAVPSLSDADGGDQFLDAASAPSEVAGDRERVRHRAVQGRCRNPVAGGRAEERAGGGREDRRPIVAG